MLPPPLQSRQLLHLLLAIPDFYLVQVQSRFHLLADQPAGHRVHIPIDVDQTARVHPHSLPLAGFHAPSSLPPNVACVQRSSARTTPAETVGTRPRWRSPGCRAAAVPAPPPV